MLLALEAAADFEVEDEQYEIYTSPEEFESVKEKLEAEGVKFTEAEITMIPENTVEVTELEQARKAVTLIELLEDHDDVQNVYTNLDIPAEIIKTLESE